MFLQRRSNAAKKLTQVRVAVAISSLDFPVLPNVSQLSLDLCEIGNSALVRELGNFSGDFVRFLKKKFPRENLIK
jgi:hypothetical protein